MQYPETEKVHIRLVSRPWLLTIFATMTLLALGIGFWFGARLETPVTTAVNRANVAIPVKVVAEERSVNDGAFLEGIVQPGRSWKLQPEIAGNAGRTVVTATYVSAGEQLSLGSLLGFVSGRPVILFDSAVPFYRNLKVGDRGPDVAAFQSAMADLGYLVDVTGTIDQSTSNAVANLYTALQVIPPRDSKDDKDTVVRWSDFVAVPGNSGIVASVAAVGTVLDEDHPMLQLSLSDPTILARATLSQSEHYEAGKEVSIAGTIGEPIVGRVEKIGEFAPADSDQALPAGKDITVTAPHEQAVNWQKKARMTIEIQGESKTALMVPTIAVGQDKDGTFVVQPGTIDSTGKQAKKVVRVDISSQVDGWSVVKVPSAIKAGDELLVQ